MAKTAAQNETIEIVDTTPLLMGLAKLKKKRAAELGNFQNPVEQKIAELSRETKAYLGSNGNSEEAVKAKIREVIKESEIKTKNEEINELAETIAKESGINNKTEVNIQAKKIRLEIEKWQREHPLEVNNFRKEQFQKEFLSEAKKLNSNLSEKQLSDLKDFSKLVAENSFKENIIDSQKDEALTANSQVSPGKLESAWSDLRTTTNFLDKKPEEVDGIKNKYNSLREGLDGVTLPSNRFTRSFDNVITSFDNPDINALLSKFRRKFGGSSFDKINNLTGGWLNRTISGAGERLAGKIGNQAIGDFVKNSLGTFAQQGFKQGMSTILNGILKGGVKAVAGTAVKGGVAAAAGAATGGLATLAMAVLAVAKKIKGAFDKLAEKFGISFKKDLEAAFGKVGGGIINGAILVVGLPFALVGMVFATTALPFILIFGGFLGYTKFVSQDWGSGSLVLPKDLKNIESVIGTPGATGGTEGTINNPAYVEGCSESLACAVIEYLKANNRDVVTRENWPTTRDSYIKKSDLYNKFNFNSDFFPTINSGINSGNSHYLQCVEFGQAVGNLPSAPQFNSCSSWPNSAFNISGCTRISNPSNVRAGDYIIHKSGSSGCGHVRVISVLSSDGWLWVSEAHGTNGQVENTYYSNINELINEEKNCLYSFIIRC